MKKIHGLLLSIILILLSIYINVLSIGYVLPNFLIDVSMFLPIVAIIIVIISFISKR